MIRHLFILLPLVLLFGTAQAESLFDFEMKSLSGKDRQSMQQFAGKPVVLMYFEPQCSWCFRQVRTLNQLQEKCSGRFQPVAVGINGSRKDLLTEVRRLRPEFPAFLISAQLKSKIGEIAGTPYTLLSDEYGHPVSNLRGYIPSERLQSLLEQHLGFSCLG